MKKLHINRADGDSMSGGGYEFGTLWQEITNGIGHMTTAIVNGLQVTERTKQIKSLLNFKKEELRVDNLNNMLTETKSNNTPFMLIGGAAIIAIMIILVMLAKGNMGK